MRRFAPFIPCFVEFFGGRGTPRIGWSDILCSGDGRCRVAHNWNQEKNGDNERECKALVSHKELATGGIQDRRPPIAKQSTLNADAHVGHIEDETAKQLGNEDEGKGAIGQIAHDTFPIRAHGVAVNE